MQAKAYFEAVRNAERQLWLIKQQQRHAMEMATRMGGQSESGIKSPNVSSQVESAAIRIADLDADLQADVKRYQDLVHQARKLIQQIPQEKFREVLTLRYLCNRPWKAIKALMGYDGDKSVFRVHGYALAAAEKILQKEIPSDTK